MSLPIPAGEVPDAFEDALQTAIDGRIASEWPFPQRVIDALEQVAAEPTNPNIAAARIAFAETRQR